MLIGEPVPRAAAAGLHFVEDQQQAVVVGQLAQALQEAIGRDADAPFALHRLDHDRGRFSSISRRTASKSPKGAYRKPAISGPIPS